MTLEEYIVQNMEYRKDTGQLIWLTDGSGKRKAGREAGFIKTFHGGKRYRYVTVRGRKFLAHRVAYLLVEGAWPDNIDHDYGDGTNNVWSNLKNTNCSGNHRNMRRYSNNTSGESNVLVLKSGKLLVRIRVDNKVHDIGKFTDMGAAVAARDAALVRLGFSVNHGKKRPV